jgi:excisionase family DNA binding protein
MNVYTLSVEEAAGLLGIGRSKAYELVRCGQFPTPCRRIGRRYLILREPFLAFLCASERSADVADAA